MLNHTSSVVPESQYLIYIYVYVYISQSSSLNVLYYRCFIASFSHFFSLSLYTSKLIVRLISANQQIQDLF